MHIPDHLIIDGNSYLNAGLLRGVDHDEGRIVSHPVTGKDVQVNGAQYGIENFFEKIAADIAKFGIAPRKVIVVWDGKNAKNRRRAVIARYKEGRDKIDEVNVQLNLAREGVMQMCRDLGMTTIAQKGMEGDDVIGYLCKMLPGRIVVGTADGDISVVVEEGRVDVWRLGEMSKNPYGPFPHKFITLYKALVGDTGDKIPGAPGFGDAKFVDLVRIFGLDGLEMMEQLILTDKLDTLKEDLDSFKPLQKIIDGKDSVALSWRCASLHIDAVNTLDGPLEIVAGMVKPWAALADDRRVFDLKQFYATSTLVHAGNYENAKARLVGMVPETPFFPLDIETSSCDESDEWVASMQKAMDKDGDVVDTLGHELTGMSITCGLNLQHTIYMTVDHLETDTIKNITSAQCREMVEVLPEAKHIVIHNRAFEFPVLYKAWGKEWAGNGWGGFVPNAIDTLVGASYVDENLPKGLKSRSLAHLGYTQTTYDETTVKRGPVGSLSGGVVKKIYPVEVTPAVMGDDPKHKPGLVPAVIDGVETLQQKPIKQVVLEKAVTVDWEERQYKMKELTAEEVTAYGCDDTACTGALHTYFKLVMDLENTWDVYLEVEQRPQYLTSLAFVQGTKISLTKLRELEKRDDDQYANDWKVLRTFLLARGWEGTVRPEFEGTLEPSDVKLAASIIMPGAEFTTKKRKLDGIAFDLREQFPDNDLAFLLAGFTEAGDVEGINRLVAEHFDGEPSINFGSPKQLQNLFYNVIGMTPRIVNPMTEKQRADVDFAKSMRKLKLVKEGRKVDVTPEDRAVWISKASTDDDTVELSLAMDELSEEVRAVLKAYQSVRQIMTRRGLFYKTYKALTHWSTGFIHSSLNQCAAVTRRYSSDKPNLQQQPKLEEDGGEFRAIMLPHCKDAVIVSCDFSGQELRSMAEQSGDENLTACYVGDNLKDVHSLTAVAASLYLWDAPVLYVDFIQMLESKDSALKIKAKALRKDAKTVNFGTQYDMQAAALSVKLKVEEEIAQKFIDAKDAAMPGIGIWKEEVREQVERDGYATTMMGARRHLQSVLQSDNRWERSKAGRQGPNFKIQGSAAEQSKLAMGEMWDRDLFTGKYDARFIAPVHDECVASVHRNDALGFIKEFHECMVRDYAGMKIPIVSSISIGGDFFNQIECGDTFDPVAIQAALDKIFNKETETA